MLNEQKANQILGTAFGPLTIKDIHWRSQDSDKSSILFYKIAEDEKSRSLFTERIAEANFGCLVVNVEIDSLPKNAVVIPEAKWPEVQKQILDELYPLPAIKLIAITGTNGKTTTTDLILQLAGILGLPGLSIGTLGVRDTKQTILDFGLTSPSLIDLRKFLNIYGADKMFCVMEASSHALAQHRFYGLEFDCAGWLSFSQDHLDYHQTMEAYFEVKTSIFKQLKKNAKLFVPEEQKELREKLTSVSDKTHSAHPISGKLPLFFHTRFNRNNLEVAVAILQDVFKVKAPTNLDAIKPTDGRFYIRPFKTNYIVVDFAHTPDALENICRGIHDAFPNHKLKVLFGCGGDRDRSKRPKMAAVVENWADKIYVTSDNPRSEEPMAIIKDIIQGIKKKTYEIIVERPMAVKLALSELTEHEVLLLAGKGHEDYILIKGVKYPYSDAKEVEQFLSRMNS